MTNSTAPNDDTVTGGERGLTPRQLRIMRWSIAGFLVVTIGGSLAAWPLTGSPVAVACTLLICGAACLVTGPVILALGAYVRSRRRRRDEGGSPN